jgi:aqualysin 1
MKRGSRTGRSAWRTRTAPAMAGALALAISACSDLSQPVGPVDDDLPVLTPSMSIGQMAPLNASRGDIGKPIPGHYIVVLNDGVNPDELGRGLTKLPNFTYSMVLNGFAGELSTSEVARLRTHPGVKYISQDQVIGTAQAYPAPPFTAIVDDPSSQVNQTPATWGIDRTDQINLPLSNSYRYASVAQSVSVYVMDTGILTTHTEFGTRAKAGTLGFDAFTDGKKGQDCHGHGTHVAGTIGGTTYGIAKSVKLRSVRVLDCSGNGSWAGFIAGLEWIAANHVKPAVMNASLGAIGTNQAAEDAVRRLISYGVTSVLAAGNSNADACNFTPARTPEAITVAATHISDARINLANSWFGSNFGTCVDVFAPGRDITSAWWTSTSAIATISGTSMAAPHVAGMAALYLQFNKTAGPGQVADVLLSMATPGIVTDPGTGSPNLLLNKLNSNLGLGGSRAEPHGNFMWVNKAGWIEARLSATAGTNFDLFLDEWRTVSGVNQWVQVAKSTKTSSLELIKYNSPGSVWHRFRVVNVGTAVGDYELWVQKPGTYGMFFNP